MNRRELLGSLAALAAASCTGRPSNTMHQPDQRSSPEQPTSKPKLPVIFAAHGAPILLDDELWMGELAQWSSALPRPKSILMISAHWEAQPIAIGATRTVPLVYDFYGFPERYYQTQYRSPGAPELASRVRELLRARAIPFADSPERGLDHGAYVPLVAMYPAADVPVLQLSLPSLHPERLFALGQSLAPLRDEGVLVFGSGFLTHNMSYAFRRGTPSWAKEFDAWAEECLVRNDVDALLHFQQRAPAASTALPTWEHYAPLLVALGAAADSPATVGFPIRGFWREGAFTKRSVQFG